MLPAKKVPAKFPSEIHNARETLFNLSAQIRLAPPSPAAVFASCRTLVAAILDDATSPRRPFCDRHPRHFLKIQNVPAGPIRLASPCAAEVNRLFNYSWRDLPGILVLTSQVQAFCMSRKYRTPSLPPTFPYRAGKDDFYPCFPECEVKPPGDWELCFCLDLLPYYYIQIPPSL